jgi:hypothetical protein
VRGYDHLDVVSRFGDRHDIMVEHVQEFVGVLGDPR